MGGAFTQGSKPARVATEGYWATCRPVSCLLPTHAPDANSLALAPIRILPPQLFPEEEEEWERLEAGALLDWGGGAGSPSSSPSLLDLVG